MLCQIQKHYNYIGPLIPYIQTYTRTPLFCSIFLHSIYHYLQLFFVLFVCLLSISHWNVSHESEEFATFIVNTNQCLAHRRHYINNYSNDKLNERINEWVKTVFSLSSTKFIFSISYCSSDVLTPLVDWGPRRWSPPGSPALTSRQSPHCHSHHCPCHCLSRGSSFFAGSKNHLHKWSKWKASSSAPDVVNCWRWSSCHCWFKDCGWMALHSCSWASSVAMIT